MAARRLRVLPLTLALAAALLGPAPAEATTGGSIVLQGRWNISAGLGYPGLFPPANSIGAALTGVGVGAIGSEQKQTTLAPVEIAAWSLGAAGTVSGNCALLSGTLNGALTPSLSLGTKVKARTFSISVTEVGQHMIVTGATSKGETMVGVFEFFADTTSGSSCTNTNAKSFIMAGSVSVFAV